MDSMLPVAAQATVDRYLALLDKLRPELWDGVYLTSYWLRTVAQGRPRLAARAAGDPVPGSVVAWTALGPGRLHHAIATCAIISKTQCADYTAELFPAFRSLLARAKAWRLGDDSITFTFTFTVADALATCDLVEAVAADARRL